MLAGCAITSHCIHLRISVLSHVMELDLAAEPKLKNFPCGLNQRHQCQ